MLKASIAPASFTGLPLALLCFAGLLVAAVLTGLVDDIRELGSSIRLDAGVNAAFAPHRTTSAIAAFLWITALGVGPAISGMAAAASMLLRSHRQARLLVPLWLTVLGAEGMTWIGKHAIGRARPAFLKTVTAATLSFSSGHTTASTALIGFRRVSLSLHWRSDVTGGALVAPSGCWSASA